MHKYFIIGLGWLGNPLAKTLKSAGHVVAGTTRNANKAIELKQAGIDTCLFDLYTEDSSSFKAIEKPMQDAYLVINIPPGRKNFSPELFVQQMKLLFEFACHQKVKHICFISTTSVFGEVKGRISNATSLAPNTASGKAHVELELYLKGLAATNNISASVLHLAGLVGEDRHPIKTLSGKTDIALGKNPVNLIHQHDVIQAIVAVLRHAQLPPKQKDDAVHEKTGLNKLLFTENFYSANLCSAEHPARADYYTWCADQKAIPKPEFSIDDRDTVDGKWIDATETIEQLGIKLKYASPYDMLL